LHAETHQLVAEGWAKGTMPMYVVGGAALPLGGATLGEILRRKSWRS
jgi:hypothetical protein